MAPVARSRCTRSADRAAVLGSPHRGGTPIEEVAMVTREATRQDQGARGAGAGATSAAPPGSVAAVLAPVLSALVGTDAPIRIAFWDGSSMGPDPAVGTLTLRSPDALRRIVWAPGELGIARAFVAGDLSVEGDIFEVLVALRDASPNDLRLLDARTLAATVRAARRLGALGAPLPLPPRSAGPPGASTRRHATPGRSATTTTSATTSTGSSWGPAGPIPAPGSSRRPARSRRRNRRSTS